MLSDRQTRPADARSLFGDEKYRMRISPRCAAILRARLPLMAWPLIGFALTAGLPRALPIARSWARAAPLEGRRGAASDASGADLRASINFKRLAEVARLGAQY